MAGLLLIVIYQKQFGISLIGLIISGHANIDLSSEIIRGYSLGIFIKPFYSIFQMIFGYHIAPTDSLFIMLFYILISISIFYLLFLHERQLTIIFSVVSILPFFFIYYFLEVISIPGFTQLESKHGILFYPVVLALFVNALIVIASKSKVIINILPSVNLRMYTPIVLIKLTGYI